MNHRTIEPLINTSIDPSVNPSIHHFIDHLIDPSIDTLIHPFIHPSIIQSIYPLIDQYIKSSALPVAHTKSLSHDKSVPLPAVSVPSPHSPPFFPHIDWRPCRRQRELETVCVWDREWGFLHCRWKVTTFRDIVDCSQRKCKRKNWILFYSFLWTWWETAKSKALEIVYRAYAGALKGW